MAEKGSLLECDVRYQRAAERAIGKSWPRASDAEEVRRQIRKLRFWSARWPTDETGQVLDVDVSVIKACRKEKIYELRITDKIGGQSNIRAIFFVTRCPLKREAVLYVLTVMLKKRQQFTSHDIETFRCGRENVLKDMKAITSRLKVV